MNELKVFQNSEFGELGVLLIDGREYFPATECATILGYSKPTNAVERHCRYPLKRGVPHPQNPEKTIELNFIPEGDLYRLMIRSRLPAAERFERWVMDEVLPEIRKHGAYVSLRSVQANSNCRLCGRWPTKVEQLPEEIRNQVDRMLDRRESCRKVSEFLAEQGFEVGQSSIWRHFNNKRQDSPPCLPSGNITQDLIGVLAAHKITLEEVDAVFDKVVENLQKQTIQKP